MTETLAFFCSDMRIPHISIVNMLTKIHPPPLLKQKNNKKKMSLHTLHARPHAKPLQSKVEMHPEEDLDIGTYT